MVLKKILILIGLLAATAPAVAAQQTFKTDFQLWNDTQLIVPLNEKKDWSAVLWVFERVGNTLKTTTDARIGGLITKRLNSRVTLGGGYLYRYSNPTFRQRRYENRYLGLATLTVPLSRNEKWQLVNRNLYQYEDRYRQPNTTILRSRFWVKRQVTIAKKKFEPFVSIEPFYDTRLKRFARYRTQAGFSHNFNEKFGGDFFYVRQDETGGGSRPGTLNGIGTSFRVNF